MKLHTRQQGFHALILVAVIAVIGTIIFAGYMLMSNSKNGDKTPAAENTRTDTSQDGAFKIYNFGVNLDDVLYNANAIREYQSMGLKGFYVFGDKLGGKQEARINPNFEFSSLKPGTKLISAIDGVVAFIKEQPDTKDFEVFIQPQDGSAWQVGYDHVSSVAVQKDARVKVGDVIGEPTVQNNGLHRFEIQINKDEGGKTTHFCPSYLLDSSVENSLQTQLTDMQNKWETTAGLELYDLTKQSPVGCLNSTTMTPEQAEGL